MPPDTRVRVVIFQWQSLAGGVAGFGLQSGKILPLSLLFYRLRRLRCVGR